MRFDPQVFAIRPQTPEQLRWGGALIAVLGLFVLAVGAAFAWILLGLPIPAEWLPAVTRIDGTPGEDLSGLQRVGFAALTIWILSFGVVAMALGLWQLALGRQHRLLLRATIVLATAILFVVSLASVISECPTGRICQ
jgi:hypothetical protein